MATDAMHIVTDLLARELDSILEEREARREERLELTDWMPKKDRARTYKTRNIDKTPGDEKYYDRKRGMVRWQLYEAGTLLLKRSKS